MDHETVDLTVSAADIAISTAASKSAYAGAVSMIFGWLVSSNAAIVVGMFVGLGGFCINWYYRHKADKRHEAAERREEEIDALRRIRLQRGMSTDTDFDEMRDV